jgi:4-aminobutyrate aminotransferase
MFAAQHAGVTPDIMTLAKGLGSGMPIGLVVAKKRWMQNWKRGAHGNTYGGNPVCCAAALATLDLVEREYMGNAATVGAYFMDKLRAMQARYACIGEVRGRGLMIGMELVGPDNVPDKRLCDNVITRAYHHGMLLLPCGASTIRFMPPLLITTADVDEAMEILEESLVDAMAAE